MVNTFTIKNMDMVYSPGQMIGSTTGTGMKENRMEMEFIREAMERIEEASGHREGGSHGIKTRRPDYNYNFEYFSFVGIPNF